MKGQDQRSRMKQLSAIKNKFFIIKVSLFLQTLQTNNDIYSNFEYLSIDIYIFNFPFVVI